MKYAHIILCDGMIKKFKILKKIYDILFFLLILVFLILFYMINSKSSSLIIDYANFNARKLAVEVLRNTGLKEVNEVVKNGELYKIIKNDNGQVENVEFNTIVLNNALIVIAKNVRKRLNEIQKGINLPDDVNYLYVDNNYKKGIIYNIPLGVTTGNVFFMNVGPKVPVKIEYIGEVGVDIKTKIEPYGINSALVSAYVYVEVIQKAIMPFNTKEIKVTSEIPIIINVVKGVTPNYILSGNKEELWKN